jgi:hypothetical protein
LLASNLPFASVAAAAKSFADPEGEPLAFRVERVLRGTLLVNAQPVVPGVTIVGPGDTFTYTPDRTGTLSAFVLRAFDGDQVSTTQATVKVRVVNGAAPLMLAPVAPTRTPSPVFSAIAPASALSRAAADVARADLLMLPVIDPFASAAGTALVAAVEALLS